LLVPLSSNKKNAGGTQPPAVVSCLGRTQAFIIAIIYSFYIIIVKNACLFKFKFQIFEKYSINQQKMVFLYYLLSQTKQLQAELLYFI